MGATNWTALPSSDGMGPITALPSLRSPQPGFQLRHFAQLGGSERLGVLDDDHPGDLVRVPELGLPVLGLRGLGAGGEEGGLVVGGDLLQPAERGAADACKPKPGQHQDDGDQPAEPERDAFRRCGLMFHDAFLRRSSRDKAE